MFFVSFLVEKMVWIQNPWDSGPMIHIYIYIYIGGWGGCEVFVVNRPPRTGKLFRFRFSLSFRVVRACVRACVTCRACEAVCARGMSLPRGGRPGGQTTTPPPRPRDFWPFLIFNGLERCPVWDAYVGRVKRTCSVCEAPKTEKSACEVVCVRCVNSHRKACK